ncbi:MAG: hypothetical protein KF761_04510 [Salinibacterium sp.]|nr:hypothetical protein [Salinibacterium sp.]
MNTSRGVIPLLAAVIAAVVVPASFVYGVSAALSGDGSGAILYQVLFVGGLALALASIIVAIVRLAKGAKKALPIATIVVALVPFAGVLALYLANLTA